MDQAFPSDLTHKQWKGLMPKTLDTNNWPDFCDDLYKCELLLF